MRMLEELTAGITEEYYKRKYNPTDARKSTGVPHAPPFQLCLKTEEELKLALRNALRYFPVNRHVQLAPEFKKELELYGHIYMYRFRPTLYEMRAYPINLYPAQCQQAAGIMLMITNNLDPRVAQYPHELITYGGNGSVFQNWAQYHLVMKYLSQMTEQQTLVIYSGHPLGLFPSHSDAPRVVVTNGMVVPNYSRREDYLRMYTMGNSQFGQMTAGSYCYIGPQGIVHGTTITLMNAARRYLNAKAADEMCGRVFVTAGLGGMSGAQPKAAVIAGMIAVVAEVDEKALTKRHEQGWVQHRETELAKVIQRVRAAKAAREPCSIGWLGNVVELWEYLAKIAAETGESLVDLGSDQTSLHNPFNGGYYPVSLTFQQSREMMASDPEKFKAAVYDSLRRQISAVNKLTAKGMKFWDYGNAFLLEAGRANADVWKNSEKTSFRYASYFEDFMGDIFSLGFGPFRWVCTSGSHDDLMQSDKIASQVMNQLISKPAVDERVKLQLADNKEWIDRVEDHKLVVGSEARILYSNSEGRIAIAEAFNQAIKEGKIAGPIMLSRDHHDVSGTDSPFRETSNVTDGSKFCADMAVHNAIGDAFRGATSVSLHNGGGTGWGEAMNGGFLLLLDGSDDALRRARRMLFWDVNNGISRRAWSGNENAQYQIVEAMKAEPLLKVTLPNTADDGLLDSVVKGMIKSTSPGKNQRKRLHD